MTTKLNKLEIEKQSFRDEISKSISVETITNAYYDKKLKKHFPEIDCFSKYLLVFKPKMSPSKKEKVLKYFQYKQEKLKYINKNGNVHSSDVLNILGITEKTYKQLKDKAYLKPAEYVVFYKWGKELSTPYYNYDELLEIKQKRLSSYLLLLEGYSNISDKQQWLDYKLFIEQKFNIFYENNKWVKKVVLYDLQKVTILEKLRLNIDHFTYQDSSDYKAESLVLFEKELKNLENRIQRIRLDLNNFITEKQLNVNEVELFNTFIDNKVLFREKFIKSLDNMFAYILENRKKILVTEVLDLKNYYKSFPVARQLKRDMNFIVGPTNSGKTYDALTELKNSSSGVYLAPLRLMALEIYDRLNSEGIPCNLLTGEEEIIKPNAKHTASTIECINLVKNIDVAIIDEFQMIGDKHRGWAWTQAILGIPANKVFVIGNNSALNHSVNILKNTSDSIKVIEKTRLSKLMVMDDVITINDLKKGDALIAFSRKDVLSYAAQLKKSGMNISVIYGSLSPEVRRKQAEMFLKGETDVLVSTDAIGMGLNLPINRIIFSSINKFDGEMVRRLKPVEVKQIAGRAGRFEFDGFVGALSEKNDKSTLKTIEKFLLTVDPVIDNFSISPNEWHVNKIAKIFNINEITKILEMFPDLCISTDFHGIYSENLLILSRLVDDILELPIVEKLKFAFTPVDIRSYNQINYFCELLDSVYNFKNNETYKFHSKNFNLYSMEEEIKIISIYNYLAKYTNRMSRKKTVSRKKELEINILKSITNLEFYYDV